jgi:hypothetical protein
MSVEKLALIARRRLVKDAPACRIPSKSGRTVDANATVMPPNHTKFAVVMSFGLTICDEGHAIAQI